jgi:hypothetical protein
MGTENKTSRLYAALVNGVLEVDGRASQEQRRRAFQNAGVSSELRLFVDDVASRSWKVGDADVIGLQDAGFSDDQIFELVVCAAVGQATRQYGSGLAALAAAFASQDEP